jgi:hypothetical protein
MAVGAYLELMLPTDSVLEVFNGPAGEFDDRSAAEADQVIVMFPPEKILIVSLLASEVDLFNESAPDEEFQGPIDCGP